MSPVTAYVAPGTLPTVAGRIVVAERRRARRSTPRRCPCRASGIVDAGDRVRRVDVDLDRARASRRSRAPALQSASIALLASRRRRVRLDRDHGRARAAGERGLEAVDRLDGRRSSSAARRGPIWPVCRCSTGSAIAIARRGGERREIAGWRSAGVRTADQKRFSPLARRRRLHERDPALLDPVAELRQHAGSTVSEPSIAIADDHRSSRCRTTCTSCRRRGTCPAIAIITVTPEIEHRAARTWRRRPRARPGDRLPAARSSRSRLM